MNGTPEVVQDALLASPISVGGVRIRPYTLQAQLVLERIGHPILLRDRPTLSGLQNAELVYCLAGDPEEVVAAAWAGREDWERLVVEFAAGVNPAELASCVAACLRQLNAAFAAAPRSAEKKSPPLTLRRSSSPPGSGPGA